MHELAIAQSILDITLSKTEECQAEKVYSITLCIGQMTGIETEALAFCFETIAEGSKAEGAKLKINIVPLTARCGECDKTFAIERYQFFCPECRSAKLSILTGRELKVEHLEVE